MKEAIPDQNEVSSARAPAGELLEKENPKAAKKAVAAKIDGEPVDLTRELPADSHPDPILEDSSEGLEILRHTASHVMAQAVQELYPGTKLAIGPAIEEGFYYDFDSEATFRPEDLEAIEERMARIVRENLPVVRQEMPLEEAKEFFRQRGEDYKLELLGEMEEGPVAVYHQGDFYDLCRGPHLVSTGRVKAFKLLKVAGAYWRGDERNKMLQRVYGTAFFDKKRLKQHLNFLKEAEKRDHRRLGKELDLFSFSEEAGAGMPIWHPDGAMLRYLIEEFERREHLKRGYIFAQGPTLLKTELWQKSGHFDNYRENMYFSEIEGTSYGIKPMNCLAHMHIYNSRVRSYRDLPLRYFELGTVHRHERSGVLHGLTRVRQFTQDDAHILCTPEQLDSEIKSILDFVVEVMELFGFEFELEISTRPEKSIGSDEDWERGTNALMKALEDRGEEYRVNEGDGAFYGPKIDVKLRDAIGRSWQCATIQCDFTLPERFDLTYVGPDNQPHRPVMIHRVILGSLERFIAVLLEHYAGRLPTWLSPVQAAVLTITDDHVAWGEEVVDSLRAAGVRARGDFRNEKLGYKIREAQLKKIPYMLVVGSNEVKEGGVSPRKRDGTDLGLMPLGDAVAMIAGEGAIPEAGAYNH